MASNYDINTNPEALRGIASSIVTYTTVQYDIIRTYLMQMSSQENEITLQKYQLCLEAIAEWLRRMEELKQEGENFAAFLNKKADDLDMLNSMR